MFKFLCIFSIIISINIYADKLVTKTDPKLDFDQRYKICAGMISSFRITKSRLESETGKIFEKGYKLVQCPLPGESKMGWGLIGKAFVQPPSKRPIRVVKDMFKYLGKTDPQLINYIYSHKDHKGRGLYDYLSLAEKRFSNPQGKYKKYYKVFKKELLKLDPTLESRKREVLLKSLKNEK